MIGQVVGNYKITDKIGEGGMGAVFKGVDLMLEREVAIKVLRPEFSSQPEIVERFRSEAVTLAKLNHPNIATLHSFFRQGDNFFMVMEFVRGETLDSIIKRSGALPCDRAIALFCQALEGIGRAHKLGIVHRDIKPANMMLTTEDGSIKVMDFGIARVLGTARMTRQGNIIGTIEYMSPEAIQGSDVDARADIYSLGILLYEMLTGRVPFDADTEFKMMMAHIQEAPPPPRDFAPHIPVSVEAAIMRALAKKPEARYQTVGEFRAVLEKSLGASTTPIAERATTPGVPATRLGEPPRATPTPAPFIEPRYAEPESPLKETRLAQSSGGYAAPIPQQQYAAPRPSFFSRLTAVHYAAAAVVLLALIAIPLAFIVIGNKPVPVEQSRPVSQPAPSSTSAPPPVEQRPTPVPSADLQQPSAEASPLPAGAVNAHPENVEPSGSAAGTSKPSKPSRKDTAAEAREKARKAAEARRLLNQ
ncbi:MAG TPA: protein kinase [Blastocatellia bacterium]|nr:protein kinase [Blastocatellia bacterium]